MKAPRGLGFVSACALIHAVALPYDIVTIEDGFSPTPFTAALLVLSLALYFLDFVVGIGIRTRTVLALVYALAVWTTLTVVWAPDIEVALTASIGMLVNLATVFFMVPVAVHLWRRMAVAYTLSALYISHHLIGGTGTESYMRAQFMGADENITAFALSIAVAAAIAVANGASTRTRAFFYTVALLHGFAIAYTGSRTGLVAFAASIGLLLFVMWRSTASGAMAKFLPTTVTLVALYAFQALLRRGMVSERLLDFSGAGFSGDEERASIVDLYWQHANEWAVFGVGQGSDALFLASRTGQYLNAHGLFWKTWVELGFVGLVLYGLIFAAMVASVWADRQLRSERLLFLVPLIPFGLTLGGQSTAIFWFAATIVLMTAAGRSGEGEPQPPTAAASRFAAVRI